jgi:hypothetical protein
MRVILSGIVPAIFLWANGLHWAMAPASASPLWYRFQSGAWEVSTDAGERRGEELLRRLIESYALLRRAAPELGAAPETPPRPVRVVVFRSSRDFAPFRRGEAHRGLYLSGAERDWILLPESGGETVRGLRHELVHLMLRHSQSAEPPRWFEEGLADYYSTLELSGGRVSLGKAPAAHAQLLRDQAWMDASALIAARPGEDAPMDARNAGLFYAQSWALVRWMMLESGGSAKAQEFLSLLASGRGQQAAFELVCGLPIPAALERARLLLNRLPDGSAPDLRNASPQPAPPSLQREPLPPPLPDVMRVEAMLDLGLDREADRLARDTARNYPSSPAPETRLGAIALRRGDFVQARTHLERAIALGGAGARTHFEYAMLVRDTNGPDALIEQSLRQSVAAEPGFAEAWLVFGNWLLLKGRAAEAAACLEQAASLDPRRSVAWEALGRALLQTGDRTRARQAAENALSAAATPEQREMARALMREIETRPAAAPKPAPALQTPAGWQPREGDARAEGRLVSIRCEDPRLLFRIEVKPRTKTSPAVTVTLETAKPHLVMLRGKTEGRREFICGDQQPAPLVAAGYIAAPATAVVETPPAPPPEPSKPASKTANKAPARKAAPRPAPAKPKPEPVAGELVWLEFR